jgi:hypothetical protein
MGSILGIQKVRTKAKLNFDFMCSPSVPFFLLRNGQMAYAKSKKP